MVLEAVKYIRKPLYVDAVRISAANFDAVAGWCQGEVMQDEVAGKGTTKKYIKVRVHNPKNARQTKAFIGDWLLYTERGYKVYTNKAFHAAFDEVKDDPEPQSIAEAAEQARAEGDTNGLVQTVPQTLTHPSLFDQIRQLQGTGQTDDQIAEVLGITADEVRHISHPEVAQFSHLGNGTPSGPPPEGTQIIEFVEATPQKIADVEQQPVPLTATNVEDVPQQDNIVPAAAEGKRVLSIAEQKELTADQVRELVQTGEAVLAQDLPEA